MSFPSSFQVLVRPTVLLSCFTMEEIMGICDSDDKKVNKLDGFNNLRYQSNKKLVIL